MRMLIFATAALLSVIAATAAEAHAFLDHAEPRVGSTVPTAPRELLLLPILRTSRQRDSAQ